MPGKLIKKWTFLYIKKCECHNKKVLCDKWYIWLILLVLFVDSKTFYCFNYKILSYSVVLWEHQPLIQRNLSESALWGPQRYYWHAERALYAQLVFAFSLIQSQHPSFSLLLQFAQLDFNNKCMAEHGAGGGGGPGRAVLWPSKL